MPLLEEGQTIRGTYEVERLLGEGAFAEVYRVKHRFLGRQAMKVFKAVDMGVEEIEQALGEAILLSGLEHPNIIRVFDANTTETSRGPCGFFTMDYVAGGSLDQFWRSFGGRFIPVEVSVEILRQVCRGLAVAHAEVPAIVHRDIKPQNILVGYDAMGLRARVSDFGLAKRVNPLTLMLSTRGTRCFKPPEVFEDTQRDSCAGDVWALGVSFYLLLTDRLPFGEPANFDSITARAFERPMIPPSRLNVQADPFLDQVVAKALALSPGDRYAAAGEFLRDLDAWRPSPAEAQPLKAGSATDEVKSALGFHSPADADRAMKMAEEALKLSRQITRLAEAADLMEEAFNKNPDLRERYDYRVKLWRRGIIP